MVTFNYEVYKNQKKILENSFHLDRIYAYLNKDYRLMQFFKIGKKFTQHLKI